MSESKLYVMDKNFNGEEIAEFNNSWLFSPIVWDILYHKYITYAEDKKSFVTTCMFDKDMWGSLNNKINNADSQIDRVCWEISQQQTFFTKDKEFIADCIEHFFDANKNYTKEIHNDDIFNRAKEIADTIRDLDEATQPYFVFKNTSCDDGVERWFISEFSDENDEYPRVGLDKQEKHCTEFVVIKENKISDFISNLIYCKRKDAFNE